MATVKGVEDTLRVVRGEKIKRISLSGTQTEEILEKEQRIHVHFFEEGIFCLVLRTFLKLCLYNCLFFYGFLVSCRINLLYRGTSSTHYPEI